MCVYEPGHRAVCAFVTDPCPEAFSERPCPEAFSERAQGVLTCEGSRSMVSVMIYFESPLRLGNFMFANT